MRIIVLGGTGYLGSRLIKRLLYMGHHILCVKREKSSLANLADILQQIQICNIDRLPEVLCMADEPYHCFFNLSCRYPKHASSDMDIYQSNLVTPLQAFLVCIRYDVKKIITIGTGLADEFDTYSISKRKFAELCKWHGSRFREQGMPLQICNVELESFYGEDEPIDRFIPGTIEKLKQNKKILLTDGDQKRDFIYVGDVVKCLAELVVKPDLPEYMDLPLGTGEGVPIRDVVEYLQEITDSCSELCFGAVEKRLHEQDSFADCTKMRELCLPMGYSWKDGLRKIVFLGEG